MIKVSAPGNIVLMGEHAVLQGKPAIGCAVNTRITVTAIPRQDNAINVSSSLGDYEGSLSHLPPSNTHKFVVAILKTWHKQLPFGLDITINAEFSHTIGLGSSAALTVALTAVIHQLLYNTINLVALNKDALAIIKKVQQHGSGLDIATSIYGGVIHYIEPSLQITPLTECLPIQLYYAGYKTPTTEVICAVTELEKKAPALYQDLYPLMGKCSQHAANAIKANDLEQLGFLMNFYHGLLDTLGVCDQKLSEMVYHLRNQPRIIGAKISGSGLGDCVVALGSTQTKALEYQPVISDIAQTGVQLESPT